MTDTTLTPTTLAVPAFDSMPPDEVKDFAANNLKLALAEAEQVKGLIHQGAQRTWLAGQAAIHLRDNVLKMDDLELWEDWATKNLHSDYRAVGWAMKYSRTDLSKPAGKTASQGKQLLIMLGDEPIPKETPRKTGALRFSNILAAVGVLRRWWRGGDAIKDMDAATLEELEAEFSTLAAIAQALRTAKINQANQ